MARPVLPTDFKDDVLAESMSGKRRYRIIQNADGTVSLDDVTDYEQGGSVFGAKQVNDMSSAVNSIEDVKAANNCTTTEPGFVLDARQGKTLMDKSNELSRDLTRVNVYVGGDGKLHFVNSGGADSVLPFSPDASAKIDKFISDSKYIDFFDSKTQNVSVVDGAQYLICDIGQYSSKIKFNSGCIINKTYTIPGNKQPDRVPSEYIITANSSTISVSGSSGAFFIRLK